MDVQIFKNGYALISKRFQLPPAPDGGSKALCQAPTEACHGTIWVQPPEGPPHDAPE